MQIPTGILRAIAASASLAVAIAARAQELAVPAVDDSPSSQLLLEQAADQARANPRESVRLLVQALDAGAPLLVRSAQDPDLFVTVATRVHALLRGDAALLAAFRREVGPDADAWLARGDLDALVERRVDTAAGLRAAFRLAERSIARGRFAAASGVLDRIADHDLLDADGRTRLEALRAAARAGLRAPAVDALAAGTFDASFASDRWSETWSLPIDGAIGGGDVASGAAVLPSVTGDRVVVDDRTAIRAFDRLSGRPLWSASLGTSDPSAGSLRMVAASPDAVVAFSTSGGTLARAGSGRVACIDPATGTIRWEMRLDRLAPGGVLEGVVPHGSPVIVDGRAIVAARKTTQRLETVGWLLGVDLERPSSAAWTRVLATTGSLRVGTSRVGDSPTVAAGVIYVASSAGAVAAVDPWDGHVRWLRRFPVPVRDATLSNEPFDAMTPAVIGDRVFVATPDRSRIVSLSATDGSVLAEVPTGTDGGIGTPAYLVGDEQSGLLLSVGDRVSCLRADAPREALWSAPAPAEAIRGRVSFARTPDARAPVVSVPTSEGLRVLDARDGSVRMRLDGMRPGNAVLAGNEVISAGTSMLSGWMPVAEAERIVRARMASSPAASEAVALLALARQVRSSSMAAEAAAESVRRAATLPAGDPQRAELLELLLDVDALDFVEGTGRDAIASAIDRAAELAEAPLRAGFARAERALRAGSASDAARIAVATALGAPADAMVPHRDGRVSAEAEAHRIVRLARDRDPRAVAGVESAVASAVGSASGDDRVRILRSSARLAAGTPASLRALRDFAAAAGSGGRPAVVRLARECASLGTELDAAFRDSLGTDSALLKPLPSPPALARDATAVREFPGRLPRTFADSGLVPGGLLSMLGTDLVFRAAPEYSIAWRAPLGTRDCTVLATAPDILVCDDTPSGQGTLTCISPDGQVRWTRTPTVPAAEALDAATPDDPDFPIERVSARRLRSPSVIPLPTMAGVAILRRDGSLECFDRATGEPAWSRAPGDASIEAWARSALAIAVAEGIDEGSGTEIRVTVLDPRDGSALLAWKLDGATEVRWMRVSDAGLVVVGTDAGIEARRIAGGDEERPYWALDGVDARGSSRGWCPFSWVAVLDRFDALALIDAGSGRFAPAAVSEGEVQTAVREVMTGAGWFAAIREDRAEFFDSAGRRLGRDAPGADRSFVAAAPSAARLFLLDAGTQESDPVPLRFQVLLRDLDARSGAMEPAAPVLLRSLGQRHAALAVIDAGLAASNGSVIQLIEFSDPSAPSGR
jgi:outer membrane protein assembly factor BamB